MQECESLEACPIFQKFRVEGTKNFWIQLYCKGPKQDQCARKVLRAADQAVPETLLPSGRHLETLKLRANNDRTER